MEKWSDGVMEYWSDGRDASHQCCNTPLLHYSKPLGRGAPERRYRPLPFFCLNMSSRPEISASVAASKSLVDFALLRAFS